MERSREFKASPQKMGPVRKLSTREEMLLVLMKLRLGINSVMLADIMEISEASVSNIFTRGSSF